jgi:hypothetical protein
VGGEYRLLTAALRAAIGAERVRGVRLGIVFGGRLPAVEDIVGREVDEGDVETCRGAGHGGGTIAVDDEGAVRLVLGLVDGCVGGGIDDEVGPGRADGGLGLQRALEIEAKAFIAELRLLKMGKAADLVEQSVHETLIYYAFPDIHWHKIRTNNPMERIMREIRRRTRVVGAFADGQSCLNLAAARLRHIAGTQWSTKRYMNMRPLFRADENPTEAAVA